MSKKLIILRGLPWTGKSFRAKQIIEENNGEGLIFSTDDYWYQVNYPDKPDEYSFNPSLLGKAHKWNQLRSQKAIEEAKPLIIIDNTNTMSYESKAYVQYAFNQDYEISVEEPTSDRWKEIRVLLQDKKANKKQLKEWAEKLAVGSQETHNVPAWSIERMMWRWQNDITVCQILASTSPY